MTEQEQAETTTAVALRETHPAAVLLSDDELRLTYRLAESLYRSGAWGLKNAEAAMAKIVVGRDLGLSPAQAMQGIHIVEGGIQMHYAQLGQFVRSREGYDFKAGWIKEEPLADHIDRLGREPTEREAARIVEGETVVVPVRMEDEEITDLRPIVGAFVEFLVNGERRGISRYTVEDAETAGLIKRDKPKSAWMAARRNMLLARAMSNGCKWFVPEVFAGMPVYAEGEIPERPKSLTAPVGDGDDSGSGIDLGPKVEEIIKRAEAQGHRGLSNRAAVELAVGKRAPGVVAQWVVDAKAELDRHAEAKAAAERGDEPEATEEPVAEEVDGEAVEEPSEPEVDDPRARLDEHIKNEREENR